VDLVELIETVIIYKLPRLTRQEIRAMLQVHDIRDTKVYQEGIEEGKQEGIASERRRLIAQLSARNMSPEEIADLLDVPVEFVRSHLPNGSGMVLPATSGHIRS
jgi:predicted transposase YdaD